MKTFFTLQLIMSRPSTASPSSLAPQSGAARAGRGAGLIAIIRLYQLISSYIYPIPSCRFIPSCSEYAIIAIDRFGIISGIILSLKRLLRCHPFCAGGFDPVPDCSKIL